MMRLPLTFVLMCVTVAACSDDPKKRPVGSTCDSDAQCESGLCYDSVCILPGADDDDDTLQNGFEVGLGMDPTVVDSDLDGKLDPDEVGILLSAPTDTDGDGRIDAIESALADADGDCIPDELDPNDTSADPDGCNDTVYGSCAEAFEAGETTGTYQVDPDGSGPAPAQTVLCHDVAQGGWTGLSGDWRGFIASAPATARQYLFVAADGSFLLSPPTTNLWSWESAEAVPGVWYHRDAAASLTSFECGPQLLGAAVGVACDGGDGLSFLPQTAGADAQAGTVEGCATGIQSVTGCRSYQVFERPLSCARDVGSMIGDGGFDAASDGLCWLVDSLEAGGGGLGANIFVDMDGAEAGKAPAIRADVYESALLGDWYANLVQERLQLSSDRAYRVLFSARAAAPRTLIVEVGDKDGGDIGLNAVGLTTEWRTFEVPVRPKQSTLVGFLRFFFGHESDASVFIDDVRIVDAGPCALPANALVPNGEFDLGLACWFPIASEGGRWFTAASGGVDDGPYAATEVYGTGRENMTLAQLELPVQSGHAYALSFAATGGVDGEVDYQLASGDAARGYLRSEPLFGEWSGYGLRFFVDPAESNTELWTLTIGVDSVAGTPSGVDGVRLTDLGVDYCGEGDWGFDFGMQCWSRVGDAVADFDVSETSASAPSVRLMNPGLTAPVDHTLFTELSVVPGTAYQIAFRGMADEQTSIIARVTYGPEAVTLGSQDVLMTPSWSSGRLSFFVPAAVVPPVIFEINAGGSQPSTVWIDDVVLDIPVR